MSWQAVITSLEELADQMEDRLRDDEWSDFDEVPAHTPGPAVASGQPSADEHVALQAVQQRLERLTVDPRIGMAEIEEQLGEVAGRRRAQRAYHDAGPA